MYRLFNRRTLWIVLIEAERWLVLRFHAGHCVERHPILSINDPALALRGWLQNHPNLPVIFLTDLAEEHYHIESLPPMTGATRRQLVMRKLSAWPAATGMQQAHYLGPLAGLRRQDAYLFSGLVSPILQACIEQLAQHQVRIRAVYTQLQCLPCWERAVRSGDPHVLHIHQTGNRLRLTYLHQARVWFSRVVLLSATTVTAADLTAEVLHTRAYLYNQQWLPAQGVLQLVWRCEDAMFALSQSLNLPADIRLIVADQHSQLKSGDVPGMPEDCSVMAVGAIRTVLQGVTLPNLALIDWQLTDWIMRAKQQLYRTSLVMLSLGAGLIFLTGLDQQVLQQQLVATRVHAQQLIRQQPRFGIPDAELTKLQKLAGVVTQLEQMQSTPATLLQLLYAIPLPETAWQLSRMDWQRAAEQSSADTSPQQQAMRTLGRTYSLLEFTRQATPDASAQWHTLLTALRTDSKVAALDWQPDAMPDSHRQPYDPATRQSEQQGSTQSSTELPSPQRIYLQLQQGSATDAN